MLHVSIADIPWILAPNTIQIASQLNSLKKPSLKDYLEEFFSSIFSYDTKLFKTLAAMLLRPGIITRDYIGGKRVSYTNPFRFLLSLAILYFLLMGLGGNFEQLNRYGEDSKEGFMNLDSSLIENIDFGGAQQDKKELLLKLDSLNIS